MESHRNKLSVVSLGELEYRVAKSSNREKNRNALIDFISAFEILPFTDLYVEIYGAIRADLLRRGMTVGTYDIQIAAQAISRSLVFVTNNFCEFDRIHGLKLEKWTKEH